MAYWLFKTEPGTWGWNDQVKRGAKGEHWDGVRNYQANNNMKAMKVGDLGFFYHSIDEKSVVGIVRIIKEHYPDHTDPKERFGMVDIEAVEALPTPVTLQNVKDSAGLTDMVLANNSRLSVQPVTADEWKRVCKMGGLKKVPTAKR